jgi:hypothetical protein
MNNSQNSKNSQNNSQNNKTIKKNRREAKASIVDLEKLQMDYSLQLNAYQQAVADYINFLQQNSEQPCNSYTANSTGISQACYNDIWQKSGCGTGNVSPNASNSWAISQTLNGLINDSWLWATETDPTHRNGCYGPNNTNYNTTTAPDFNINAPPMTTMQGKAFWGSGSVSVSTGGTVEQCQALCASTSNCSGATYNPTAHGQPMCWLRTGEGQVVPALDTDVAIIPEAQKYLLTIESINNKLISTNQQIQNVINTSQPVYNSMQTEGREQNRELIKNYMQLVSEREKIAEMLKSYEDLDKSQQQGEIRITQKRYSYILLVIIAIGVIILLYKFSGIFTSESGSSQQTYNQTGGEIPQSTYYVLLIIIILIILFNYYSNIKKTATDATNSISSVFSSVFGGIFSFFSLNDN